MTEARLAMLGAESAEAATNAGVPGYFADVNLYRALLRHPDLARPIADLVVFLWRHAGLPARLRELVIMRVAWCTGCEYEWAHHWSMAQRAGWAPEQLLAVRDWPAADRFDECARTALTATDETLLGGAVTEDTWRRLAEQLGDERLVLELLATISTWRTVSELVQGMGVPLEDGFTPWPPDGTAPDPASVGVRRGPREGLRT